MGILGHFLLYSNQKDLEEKKISLEQNLEDNESDLSQIEAAIEKDRLLPDDKKDSNEEANELKKDFPQFFSDDRSIKDSLEDLQDYKKDENKSLKSEKEDVDNMLEGSPTPTAGSRTPTKDSYKDSSNNDPKGKDNDGSDDGSTDIGGD